MVGNIRKKSEEVVKDMKGRADEVAKDIRGKAEGSLKGHVTQSH